jgi:hypothetical protein
MRTASTLAACLLLLAPTRFAVAGDCAAALVARAGADMLGYVRIENPKTFLEKLDPLTARLGARASDDLPLFAQRFLKNPLLAGIEMDQPWSFILLDSRRHTNNLAIVVGVSDAAIFCESFGKGGVSNVKPDPATATAAVRHYTETEDTYDHAAYVTALRAGKKLEPLQFRRQVTKQYYVTACNGQGLIVGSASLLDKLTPVANSLGHDRVRGDLAVAIRVPAILSLYEKEIRQRKETILSAVQSAARASPGAVTGTASRFNVTLNAGFDVALSLARQVGWLEAAAELTAGRLTLRFAAPPLPGTAFNRALAGQQPLDPDEVLLGVMPRNAVVLGAMRFTRTPEWIHLLTETLQPLAETMTLRDNPDGATQAREAFRSMMETWGDGIARAILAPMETSRGRDVPAQATPTSEPSDHNTVEVLRVGDAARARQAQRKAVAAGLPLGCASPPSGETGRLRYDTNIARHAGVEIDRVTFERTDPAAPEKPPSHILQQVAFVGRLELIAQGPDSTNTIRRLIAAAKKPAAPGTPNILKTTGATFPKKHNGIFYMNLADYVGLIRSAALTTAEDAQLRRLQAQLAEAKAMHTGWLLLQPRAVSVELVIPLDQVLEIMLKDAASTHETTRP